MCSHLSASRWPKRRRHCRFKELWKCFSDHLTSYFQFSNFTHRSETLLTSHWRVRNLFCVVTVLFLYNCAIRNKVWPLQEEDEETDRIIKEKEIKNSNYQTTTADFPAVTSNNVLLFLFEVQVHFIYVFTCKLLDFSATTLRCICDLYVCRVPVGQWFCSVGDFDVLFRRSVTGRTCRRGVLTRQRYETESFSLLDSPLRVQNAAERCRMLTLRR